MKKAFIFLADCFEEVEGLTVVDLLRRAEVEIQMVSIGTSKHVTSSHGVKIEADVMFDEIKDEKVDMLILPGGMPGTTYLKEHVGLGEMLTNAYEAGTYVAAICAAPTVFAKYGFTDGRRATSYPAMEPDMGSATYVTDEVVVDGNVITSRGLGTAILFAGKLVEMLMGSEARKQVLESIVYEDR